MDTNCEKFTTQLDAYLDGELPVEARAEVERHLNGCAACSLHLQSTSRVVNSLKALPQPAVPKSLSDKLDAIAERQTPTAGNVLAMRAPMRLLAAAAAVSVLILAGMWVSHNAAFLALWTPKTAPEVANQSEPSPANFERTQKPEKIADSANLVPAPAQHQIAPTKVAAGTRPVEHSMSTHPMEVAHVAPHAVPGRHEDQQQVAENPANMQPEQLRETSQEEPGLRSIAELPSEKGSFETVGVATDEDGLYDIRM
jgi:predicted anti-sigma-YlaC factor YlaD